MAGTEQDAFEWTLSDHDHHSSELYLDTGEGEVKSMEIRYERE